MDAFSIVVGFAGITPDYFYNCMSVPEFVAIGQAYREDWEKSRLPVLAIGGKLSFPWDGKGLTARGKDKTKTKYSRQDRISIGEQLAKHFNKN